MGQFKSAIDIYRYVLSFITRITKWLMPVLYMLGIETTEKSG